MANAEPVQISGQGRVNRKNNLDSQASVILKFADNSMAVISTADDLEMFWQFEVLGTKGILKILTNPWLPASDANKIIVYLNGEAPKEFTIECE